MNIGYTPICMVQFTVLYVFGGGRFHPLYNVMCLEEVGSIHCTMSCVWRRSVPSTVHVFGGGRFHPRTVHVFGGGRFHPLSCTCVWRGSVPSTSCTCVWRGSVPSTVLYMCLEGVGTIHCIVHVFRGGRFDPCTTHVCAWRGSVPSTVYCICVWRGLVPPLWVYIYICTFTTIP